MTRAGETDNNGEVTYSDGLGTEYAIKNATLIIFDNETNEDEAKFVGAYNINTSPWTGGTSNNVTEMSTKVVRLVSSDVTAGYKALIVLNHNNILTVADDGGLSVNGTAFTATSTYADYKSEAEAQAGTVYDQIFVERGVAKVTVAEANGTMTNSKVGTTPDLKWQVTGWVLDNPAPTTYLVRSTVDDDNFRKLKSNATTPATAGVYRYIGNTEVKDGANGSTGKYRTYFAPSVSYDTWAASGTYTLNTYTSGDFATTFGENYPKYCYENTFKVDNQTVKNTTLVQLAITAKQGTDAVDLYTLSGQKSTVYTKDLLEAAIKEAAYYVLLGDGVVFNAAFGTSDITVTMPATSKRGTVILSSSDEAGIKVQPNTAKIASGYIETDFYTNLSATLGTISCYKDGVSYYSVRIKHFGDNLTPWNGNEYGTGTAPASGDIAAIYPNNSSNRDGDYLGRYGVLRNNWHDIQVNSVRSLGDAEPHTGIWPDTPDDELDNYLAFRINVLSWAKRTQGVNL